MTKLSTQLRIGNLLFKAVPNPEGNIIEASELITVTALNIESIDDLERLDIQSIYKPIPLTEEWLVKIANPIIVGNHSVRYELELTENLTLNLFRDQSASLQEGKAIIILDRITYFHQLQNLFFALTGKELEIK